LRCDKARGPKSHRVGPSRRVTQIITSQGRTFHRGRSKIKNYRILHHPTSLSNRSCCGFVIRDLYLISCRYPSTGATGSTRCLLCALPKVALEEDPPPKDSDRTSIAWTEKYFYIICLEATPSWSERAPGAMDIRIATIMRICETNRPQEGAMGLTKGYFKCISKGNHIAQ
jgi:hypothetical protein